ncbi:MAG: DUF2207 domain-containing protein [Pseudomonadota bacterium]
MLWLRRSALGALAVFLLLGAGETHAQSTPERIKSYISDITVQTDGTLLVRETITVHAAGYKIKRGIYRDFPTIYSGPLGLKQRTGFDLIEVLRDGEPEPHFTEALGNGVRLYIGDENTYLPEGDYTYTIVYESDWQIRFDEDFDELYWNVTGNDWDFTIERAEARVTLPAGAEVLEVNAYTGSYGQTGTNYKSAIVANNVVQIATTSPLSPYQGLTISVTWPKGVVAEPSGADRAFNLLTDNLSILIGVLGFVLTVLFFLRLWNRVGRDPEKGVVIPLFKAPDGMPPVVVGYTASWGFGAGFSRSRAFAVALTSMATKGAVSIVENDDDSFTVTRAEDADRSRLSPGEKAVFDELFGGWSTSITLSRTYDPEIGAAVKALAKLINGEYTDVYFRKNRGAWAGGTALAVISAVIAAVVDAQRLDDLFIVGFLSLFGLAFGFGAAMLWIRLAPLVAGKFEFSARRLIGLLAGLVFAVMFSAPAIGALSFAATMISLPVFIIMLLNAGTVVLFWFLLRAPTMHGRQVMDEIEGYKLYLSVAESDRMNMFGTEPAMTLELFERHLPYAMALDVAEAWTEHFEAQIPPEQLNDSTYRPRWYRSHRGISQLSSMTSTLSSSLSTTVSSASTRPSSSSSGGSSGGGSSGGGGGGGGGGGW